MPAAVRLDHVRKRVGTGRSSIMAVDDVDLAIGQGEFVALVGPSGSGKSTLLHLIAGLDRPSEGRVLLFGQDLARLSDDERAVFRLHRIGFVFQAFHLLPTLTVEENVRWPVEFLGVRRRDARRRAGEALDRLSIPLAAQSRRPQDLSGGEQQRVAIARAIVTEPVLVLADEPTGNLDSVSGRQVIQLLCELRREKGLTIVMVTHSRGSAAYSDRVVSMRDGRIHTTRGVDLGGPQA